MPSIKYPTQLVKLDGSRPNVAVFIIQASNPGGEDLTAGQVDAARSAAASVLQLLGAEVATNSSVFTLDEAPFDDGELSIDISAKINRVEA